ncbi:MAG: hypothetical protein ABW168_03325, partial [Sedimenticola sp.]
MDQPDTAIDTAAILQILRARLQAQHDSKGSAPHGSGPFFIGESGPGSPFVWDEEIAQRTAIAFTELGTQWPQFELRPDQLAFAYAVALEGKRAVQGDSKALALGMGCGEGKQDGFAVGMRVAWEWAISQDYQPKFLFVTSTPDLLSQMAASRSLQAIRGPSRGRDHTLKITDSAIHLHQGGHSTHRIGSLPGIHLIDNQQLLQLSLDVSEGAVCPLFDGLSKVYLDEVQAWFAHTPLIRTRSGGEYQRLLQESPALAGELDRELELLEQLFLHVRRLTHKHPEWVRYSNKRHQRRFDDGALTRNGHPVLPTLHTKLKSRYPQAIAQLGLTKLSDFAQRCDLFV